MIGMFGKLSRYRAVPDVVAPDAAGRTLAAKDIRLLPAVSGTVTHTVEAGDRLDQLAHAYYGEPLLYWRICDANPDFLSPLALLDQEPVVTTRFPVTAPADGPPWAAVSAALSRLVGVEDVRMEEDVVLEPRHEEIGGERAEWAVQRFERAVLVRYNRTVLGLPDILGVLTGVGFAAGPPAEAGQLGRPIVVPAPPSG